MKIGIIQASFQADENQLLYDTAVKAAAPYGHEVINFGCFPDEAETYSYVEIALEISLLLESRAVDFVVTGCSSGQGMMLACNSMPGIICGYVQNPQDAYLFGRINDGNAASFPLGLNFGWAGEINLQCTLEKLFDGDFGSGYPPEDAERKMRDTKLLKEINVITKKALPDIWPKLNEDLQRKVLQRKNVVEYIKANGTNEDVIKLINQ